MRDAFERNGFNVLMVREDDISVDPYDRYTMVKKSNADLCLCNHLNAFNTKASGSEVIHSVHNDTGFAYKIYNSLLDAGFKGRRVFSKSYESNSDIDYYFMHRMTGSVETYIIEYAFIDNDEDYERYLNNWKQGVENIVKTVCERYGVDYMSKDQEHPIYDKWQLELGEESINELVDLGIIDTPETHKDILIKGSIPPWVVYTLFARVVKELKGEDLDIDTLLENLKIVLDKDAIL